MDSSSSLVKLIAISHRPSLTQINSDNRFAMLNVQTHTAKRSQLGLVTFCSFINCLSISYAVNHRQRYVSGYSGRWNIGRISRTENDIQVHVTARIAIVVQVYKGLDLYGQRIYRSQWSWSHVQENHSTFTDATWNTEYFFSGILTGNLDGSCHRDRLTTLRMRCRMEDLACQWRHIETRRARNTTSYATTMTSLRHSRRHGNALLIECMSRPYPTPVIGRLIAFRPTKSRHGRRAD